MLTKRRRILAAIPITVALAFGSLVGSSSVLATGTCPGHQTEYLLAAETQTVDPLEVYDLNHDGIICVAVKGKKTVYSDNKI
jgi:cytochrome oxidase Cu insertion factor (SCO1/SenC/PrrC family)